MATTFGFESYQFIFDGFKTNFNVNVLITKECTEEDKQ